MNTIITKKINIIIAIFAIVIIGYKPVFGTAFVVTSNADAGAGTLRQAILDANADATSTALAPHVITFNAPMTITIVVTGPNTLPEITRHCNIDGGTLGTVVLNLGNSSANSQYGFRFTGPNVSGSIVQRMVIHNLGNGGGAHIWFNPSASSGSSITVTNNRIGTNAAGTGAGPRGFDVGIAIYLGDNVIVNGTNACVITNNLIAALSSNAIQIDRSMGGHTISNNLIGTDVTGAIGGAAFRVLSGILIRWPNSGNTISNNTISNITARGIECWNGTINSTFSGNKIGTNSAGTAAGVNFRLGTDGLHLNNGCSNNIVEDNLVSNCNSGIFLWDNSNNNIIRRNFVGTDITGNAGTAVDFRTYWDGIQVDNNCSSNMIGGLVPSDGNVVCNSFQAGIALKGGNTMFNMVMNNKIGVGLDGTTAMGNDRYGIYIGWGPVNNSIGAITSGGTVYGNIIANTVNFPRIAGAFPGNGAGIFVDRNNTINNSIRGNSIYCNKNSLDGITWDASSIPQSNVATPTVNAASTNTNIFGSGLAVGDTVDIYYNETVCMSCPRVSGITYIATVIANASGNWSYTGGVPVNSIVTVTNTQKVGASFGNTSRFSPCSVPLPLPVELISFTANKVEEGVLLNWATSKEINNNYFKIQRSLDGVNFETIGVVTGNGNTDRLMNYSFVDLSDLNGTAYYRLIQVDYDTKSTPSKIIKLNSSALESLLVYPSPTFAGNELNIILSGGGNSNHSIVIVDVLGRVVYSIQDSLKTYSVSTTGFSKGLYTILFQQENQEPTSYRFTLE